MKGYFTFVLHSHLPYVLNHGSWPHGMDWIFEAAAETYIPLISTIDNLTRDGITPNLTLGITPVLCEQLASDRFKEGLEQYLQQKIDSAKQDYQEFTQNGNTHLARLSEYWIQYYSRIKNTFDTRLDHNIVGVFGDLQRDGYIEIITSAATHGYFPLLGTDESISAQVRIGKESYEKHFGREPVGIWLPECAYRPGYKWTSPVADYPKAFSRKGVEAFLAENGIRYFIVDSALIKGGESRGVYIDRFESLKLLWKQFESQWKPEEKQDRSVYENYVVASEDPEHTAVVYGRHAESALQVWSGEWGYPGNGQYIDFHKKHFPGGHRYWRVTDAKADLAEKQEYHPETVEEILENQSTHFVESIEKYLGEYHDDTGGKGIITAPFDTELFGHWWFEGPRWMEKVLRKMAQSDDVETITLGTHLEETPAKNAIALPEGSWGQGGFHYIWLNSWNEWTWKHIYRAEDIMVNLADKYGDTEDPLLQRLLNQMTRELLLMESSDWQFLISTWSARDYAEQRLSVHKESFDELHRMVHHYEENGALDSTAEKRLEKLESVDEIFGNINFRYWKSYDSN